MPEKTATQSRIDQSCARLTAGGSAAQRDLIARALRDVFAARESLDQLSVDPIDGGVSGAEVLLVKTGRFQV